jgi:hypothetical protein
MQCWSCDNVWFIQSKIYDLFMVYHSQPLCQDTSDFLINYDVNHHRLQSSISIQSLYMSNNTIRRSSTRGGNGLFATTRISSGSPILEIPSPLVTVPDDAHLAETCSYCMLWMPQTSSQSMLNYYTEDKSLSFCTGCNVVKYCGKVA